MTLRRFPSLLASLSVIAIACVAGQPALAQIDTVTRRAPAASVAPVAPVDSLRAPISPKRAFLYSLLVPGAAQNRLGRHRAAVGLLAVEFTSVAMIRESGADVREARLQLGDSLVMSYVDATGNRLTTPVLERRRFEDVEVASRRSHVEDWVALLIANHLFAAADAFVAASLWDVPARVSVTGNRNRLMLIGQIRW